jgi:sec-independent protein translocase protein TatA
MPFGLGIWEVLIILAVVLLVFGPKRLPDLGGALGKGIREFRRSIREIESEVKHVGDDRDLAPPRSQAAVPPAREATAQPREAEKAEAREPGSES